MCQLFNKYINYSRDGKKFEVILSDDELYNDGYTSNEISNLEVLVSKECKMCDVIKVPYSHHCSTCGSCHAKMSHHCTRMNNCAAYYNKKHYLLYMIYVVFYNTHALVVVSWKTYNCLDREFNVSCEEYSTLFNIILGIFSIVFMIVFTFVNGP